MAKVSIIVPVYGVEQYLNQCVESLIHQTFTDIEIILVDDGSKDRCPKMCDEWAKKDQRIKVIHKINGGLSDARNEGVKHASSDYIIFVDSDDYVELEMCEVLYNAMITQQVDMTCSLVNEVIDGEIVGNRDSFTPCLLNKEEALYQLLSGKGITMYACGKIYKKELFNQIQFPKGKVYEDAFTTPYLIDSSKSVYMISDRLYNYVRRNDSITLSKYSSRDWDCIEAHRHNYTFIKEKYPKLIEPAMFRYFWSLLYIYDKMVINHQETSVEGKKLWEMIKEQKMAMYKNTYLSRNRKIALFILSISKALYRRVLNKMN